MNKKPLAFLIGALLATSGAWAGPPGQNTNGSTVHTVEADVDGFAQCILADQAFDQASDVGSSAAAWASALQFLNLFYEGDVKLDLVRHGMYGAVHQVHLTGSMGSGTLYIQLAQASADTEAEAEASANADVEAVAEAIADAFATIFAGIDVTIDLIVTEIDVMAGALVEVEAEAIAEAEAEADASGYGSGSGDATGGGTSVAVGAGAAGTTASFYVQGAKIEEFSTQLSLNSATFNYVYTDALASSYASAFATAAAYAMAKASVEAEANAELTFVWDLPILGSGSLPIVLDSDSASEAATVIANAVSQISAWAAAAAEATSELLAESSVGVTLAVEFEDLPGIEDWIEVTAEGAMSLSCSSYVNAQASALVGP
jgi:hypothetical protein